MQFFKTAIIILPFESNQVNNSLKLKQTWARGLNICTFHWHCYLRDMPIIDVTFANRDSLGTRKHALVTHHVGLHDSLLRACCFLLCDFGLRRRDFRISWMLPVAFPMLSREFFSSPSVTMA